MNQAALELKAARKKAAKPLLYIGIASIVMLFAAFTSAYVVSRGGARWTVFELPQPFYTSTAIILLSSVGIQWAVFAAKKNQRNVITFGIIYTLVLGFVFSWFQVKGWEVLVNSGIYFSDKSTVSGSYLYILTAVHLAHLGGGIIALLIALVKSILGKYSPENRLGLELCAIYWHFLGILWVYLFLFLLFIR